MQTDALMNLKDILSKAQVNEAWLRKRRRGEEFLLQPIKDLKAVALFERH